MQGPPVVKFDLDEQLELNKKKELIGGPLWISQRQDLQKVKTCTGI